MEQRFNFVLIDRYIPNIDVSYVVSDNLGGAYQAVEHLIKLGHHRIGIVTRSSLQTTSVRDRVDGYKRALLDYGLPFDQSLVCDRLKTSASELEFFGTARGNSQHDVEVMVEFLKNKERPSAIFAINDLVALAVVEAASLVGLRIPDDLALVGFDDIDIVSHLETPLTTMAQDKYAIGAQAAEFLIDKIEGREKGNRQIVIPTKLIVRRSTASACEARQVAN
jgi:DNA-binding LacI/PurR family transcriptional regulator